jgi:antitoxin StbD
LCFAHLAQILSGKYIIFDTMQKMCAEMRVIMAIAADILQSLVPISQFNKGQAAKIFDRLHSENELIVLKNNQPSAIILSPEEYTRLTEIEEDYYLLLEANRRLEADGNNKTVSLDTVMNELGISEDELLDAEDVDIE